MMIAKSWMDITANVAGCQHPSPFFSPGFLPTIERKLLEQSSALCQISATVRSRTA